MVSRHRLYFGGFVVSGFLLVGAALMALLKGLSALSGDVPPNWYRILLTVLTAAPEWVVLVLGFGLVAVLFLIATIVSVLRSRSLPRDDRLVSVVERLEREYPILRQFDVSQRVEPTAEDRRRELKERYVEGDIGDAEFERRMDELMDDPGSEGSRRSDSAGTTEEDAPR
ncbi:hypothetical protein BRD05_08315 [Halobacteriales archaeon QS_9_70_65]|nr:MAG: hypothetical protein BRD05_08315 [Halobacteriales archaeon QS_9_70_65]